ncbi:phage portal protein [Bifidobacterium tissieri]|uniref:Phage portal protein n=1 Tax=Bifidobacterium tissieri TaxID=1630162 RepID=A0A5M9ZVQ5_9BIFI|nr:phage portal protein [Bifidobacterium tissieri]
MSSSELATASGGKPFLAFDSLPSIRGIQDIDEADWDVCERLLKVWIDKNPGNSLRSLYYNAHQRLKDFGITVPNRIMSNMVMAPVGWPAKAVRALADLSAFEGFSTDMQEDTPLSDDLATLFERNALDITMSQSIVSAYMHSCSFLTVTAGETPDDPAVVTPRSAEWSAAIWDSLHNRIGSALTITDADEHGMVTGFNVWLPDKVYIVSKPDGIWQAHVTTTNYGRPSVVALSYDPQLDRPFGRSRISRPLMSLTDIAFRTLVRMECNAEFYSSPKLWFLGLDPNAFSTDRWKSLVSSINSVSKDIDGDVPSLQQVSQASMQPHSDMLRTIAMLVASETSLPVNDLGITLDNPGSAEAMAAAERKLSREADRQNRLFSRALKDVAGMALNLTADDIARITPVWAPTREVSDAARADYYAKIAGVNTAFADSDIGLMKAGLTYTEIQSFRAWQQRQRAQESIDRLKQQALNPRQEVTGDGDSEPAAGQSGTQETAGTGAAELSGQSR